MDDRQRTTVADLPHRVREWVAGLPRRWRDWRRDVRADPATLLHSPLFRLGIITAGGIGLVFAVQWLVGALQPPGKTGAFAEATPYATLYVACDNPNCRAHYTVQQELDFKDWPLICRKCGEPTIFRATLCRACRKWFAVRAGEPPICPHCTAQVEEMPEPEPQTRTRSPDDAEDPW